MNLGNLYIVGAVVGVIVLTTLLGALLAGAASFCTAKNRLPRFPKKKSLLCSINLRFLGLGSTWGERRGCC